MVDQPHLPGDIRSPMPAQPRQVCYPACAAVPAPGTVPSGRCRPPARTHQKTMPSIPFSDCKTLVESESKKIPNQKIRLWGHGPPLLSWGPRRAHCTSPGTTTHAAAPKNDIMLFVAVLPLGEPENLWVSDASYPQRDCPGVKLLRASIYRDFGGSNLYSTPQIFLFGGVIFSI